MKRLSKYSLLAASALFTISRASSAPLESRYFTPYFNMGVTQGAYLPSSGDFFSGAQMNMNVGLLTKIAQKHNLFALYSLNFAGQAFRPQDTSEFDSKDLSHNFNFEYRWNVWKYIRLRPSAAYGFNLTRTAANEVWGEGLYDSKSVGGGLAVDYTFELFDRDGTLTGNWLYRNIKYPNYTDIIREFQGTDSQVELAAGLKDQKFNELGLMVNWSRFFARFRYNFIDYSNERVVESNGTYGAQKQKDTNVILSAGANQKVWIFETAPEISYTLHRSNQNFLLFQSATDPSPVFASNYYDYNETDLNLPLFLNFTKKWALNLGVNWKHRGYNSRQPREGTNSFIAGKTQSNDFVTLTGGLRKKMNEVASMFLTYSQVVATSNNKFQRYLPSNYTGQSISLGFQLTY